MNVTSPLLIQQDGYVGSALIPILLYNENYE